MSYVTLLIFGPFLKGRRRRVVVDEGYLNSIGAISSV